MHPRIEVIRSTCETWAGRSLSFERLRRGAMKAKLWKVLIALAVSINASTVTTASVVTSIPDGSILQFPLNPGYCSPCLEPVLYNPVIVAPGVEWSTTFFGSVYGYVGSYGFDQNGVWETPPPMVGLNNPTGSMTFNFSNPVSSVGGILNWAKDPNQVLTASISAYDSNNVLIETLQLFDGTNNLVTPDTFYGFEESTREISSFVLTGDWIGIETLTVDTTPLPATLPL